ncbi:MAG TPA: TetR/AcrR family transcriptional regulator [Acidimicrobiales bacterium]|nr:TetR/AcrR family transcriptional regulator [Acidimicrobiales bacterium]
MAVSSAAGVGRASRGRRAPRISGDDRERAILARAEQLLEDRPLQEISVDDLARGAGISRSAFYFYFPSKEAVLLSLLDGVVEEARGTPLVVPAGDPRTALKKRLEAIHGTFRAHRAVTLAAARARGTNAEVRQLWARVMEAFVQDTTEVIEAERDRGAAPGGIPARDLAVALNRMNERVLEASFDGDTPALDDAAVIDTLVEVWLRAIYAAVTPPRG